MRILVIGGSGFIGPPLVRELCDAGHELTLFHRGRTPATELSGVDEIECPEREIADRSYYSDFLPRFRELAPQVVIDMIPTTEASARAVVETFRDIAERLVTISSQDVYRAYGVLLGIEAGAPQAVPVNESAAVRERLFPYRGAEPRAADDPRRWMDDYEKILVERTARGDDQLPATVLRLPMVYGPHDRQHRLFEYLKRMLDGRRTILLCEEMAAWRWTRGFVEDVAHAIALAAQAPQAVGRVYNVGEREALPLREWIAAIGAAVDWPGEVVTIPYRDLPPPFRPQIATDQDLVADTSRIRDELDFAERVPREEALARTVAWEREHPPERVDPRQFDYAAEDELLARIRGEEA
ncbi:MAG: NAD-dependent epimerase/dehydratase family protein [Candidatus Eisenbacteria bacterium]|nr:NAD-dependent epimerase/dehydratase family protein [Candidatus Eisenbacteria bacterium]